MAAAPCPHSRGGLTLYVERFGLGSCTLTKLDVNTPVLSLGYLLAAAVAYFWLSEAVTLNMAVGIALVMAGMSFLTRTPAASQATTPSA